MWGGGKRAAEPPFFPLPITHPGDAVMPNEVRHPVIASRKLRCMQFGIPECTWHVGIMEVRHPVIASRKLRCMQFGIPECKWHVGIMEVRHPVIASANFGLCN